MNQTSPGREWLAKSLRITDEITCLVGRWAAEPLAEPSRRAVRARASSAPRRCRTPRGLAGASFGSGRPRSRMRGAPPRPSVLLPPLGEAGDHLLADELDALAAVFAPVGPGLQDEDRACRRRGPARPPARNGRPAAEAGRSRARPLRPGCGESAPSEMSLPARLGVSMDDESPDSTADNGATARSTKRRSGRWIPMLRVQTAIRGHLRHETKRDRHIRTYAHNVKKSIRWENERAH